ncbi:MAG: hypothetical protein J6L61_04295 [Ruminiclostridium sp.]|nr:hypothetical protein [Ruminiclostridium sp.]
MLRFFQRNKGAVSIFLVLILVPMMTVSSLFVDAGKVSLARGAAASAGDLTLNTALTDYDTQLKELYGLFATAQDTDELYARLEDYYRTCITSGGVSASEADSLAKTIVSNLSSLGQEEEKTSDILNMKLVDFEIGKRADGTLANPAVLKKEIVDFMKYRGPINTGLSFISSLKSFSTLSKQTDLVDKRTEYYKAEEDAMKSAHAAWKQINEYNKSKFVQDSGYFKTVVDKISKYPDTYKGFATTTIKDLYDAQDYVKFESKIYNIEQITVTIEGDKKTIPCFYTNEDRTSHLKTYNELTGDGYYSNTNKASADDVKKALTNYYNARESYVSAADKMLKYNDNTYGQQFLIQTNRGKLYENWIDAMKELYNKYNEMQNAVTYADVDENGVSVMTTTGTIGGETGTYGDIQKIYSGNFDSVSATFNIMLNGGEASEGYNSTLKKCSNNSNADTTEIDGEITSYYNEINEFRKQISDASDHLDTAITELGKVLDKVKSDGTLQTKKNAWETAASDSEIKNTTMSKQDLAEIDSVSKYLNEEDVKKLITRLQNIKTNLDKMLEQIDSYKFFDTKIVEIHNYSSLHDVLKNKIGNDTLYSVPTNADELKSKAKSLCEGKFSVGTKVDYKWVKDPQSNPRLVVDKPNFYAYLYTNFNVVDSDPDVISTTEKTSKNSVGEDVYNNIKSKSASDAEAKTKEAESGDKTKNEIKDKSGIPSKETPNSGTTTPSATASTGDDAAKNATSGLGSMFSNLGKELLNMAEGLRDRLYVSDYIMNMFSYDTLEAEFKKENGDGATLDLKTLTQNPINADNNFAYGAEVEYIIYGGSNSENITKAYGSIYAIRLAFNLIYAFSDSEIREGAFGIATPISAATMGIIPVPLIQGAIIIGLACCESGLDIYDMHNGEKVPLFKNSDTWRLSFRGLVDYARNKAGEIAKKEASRTIDTAQEKLSEWLDMTDEQLNENLDDKKKEIDKYLGKSFDDLIGRHAETALQKFTQLATESFRQILEPGQDQAQYVYDQLTMWIEEEGKNSDPNDIGFIVKKEAVKIIKENGIQLVLDEMKKVQNDYESAVDNLSTALTDQLSTLRKSITEKVTKGVDVVKDYKDKMLDEVKSSMNQGADKLKETINSKLDGIFPSGGTGDDLKSTDQTGLSSLLSFGYKDYLRLFLMIALYTDESGTMARTADVIQVNMDMKNSGYLLKNSAAYVELHAEIQVKPTLLPLPLFADVKGNPANNAVWYTISYDDVRGY